MSDRGVTRPRGVDSLTTAIVDAIADREGVEPVELRPPLNTAIDLDALADLVTGENVEMVRVEFTYNDHRITIEDDEEVRISIE